jgi:hypothetical protein
VEQLPQLRKALRSRPVLERHWPLASDEFLRRLNAGLASADCRCNGSVMDKHVELLIRPAYRHFWSPWLSGELESDGEGGSKLFARFGPHPSIWTGFAMAYAIMAAGLITVLVYGLGLWMVGSSPWVLWLAPIFVGVAGLLYLGSLVGRRLASEQIGWMLQMLDCSLEELDECGETRCAVCPRRNEAHACESGLKT